MSGCFIISQGHDEDPWGELNIASLELEGMRGMTYLVSLSDDCSAQPVASASSSTLQSKCEEEKHSPASGLVSGNVPGSLLGDESGEKN